MNIDSSDGDLLFNNKNVWRTGLEIFCNSSALSMWLGSHFSASSKNDNEYDVRSNCSAIIRTSTSFKMHETRCNICVCLLDIFQFLIPVERLKKKIIVIITSCLVRAERF